MKFLCSRCHKILSIENAAAGDKGVCNSCHRTQLIPPDRFSPRVVIDDFAIIRELGQGAMGTVFLAHQLSLDREVALKILRDEHAGVPRYVQDFVREARAAARIQHPNIIQAYAVGEDEGTCFLAMEYVDGTPVNSLLRNGSGLPLERAVAIVSQIAEALDYAWEKHRMVHLDVKPENILLTSAGVAKLADLGLAQLKNGPVEDVNPDEFMGSPPYVAPEVILGHPSDHRTDLYSLGATFYHILTGQFPFDAETAMETAAKHLSEAPRPVHELVPSIPQSVCQIIEKLMAKSPSDRCQTGKEVAAALKSALDPGAAAAMATGGSPASEHSADPAGRSGLELCVHCKGEIEPDISSCPHCGADLDEARQLVLTQRHSLLQELTKALEAADTTGAAQVAATLARTDAQFACGTLRQKRTDLVQELRKRLEDVAERAKATRDIEAFAAAVANINTAFGEDNCAQMNQELNTAKGAFRYSILRANAARRTNCISTCLDILNNEARWHGGSLGERREELLQECRDLAMKRARAIAETEHLLLQHKCLEALKRAKPMSQFRVSDKLKSVKPSPEDIAVNNHLLEVLDMLNANVKEAILAWIDENRWEAVTAAMRALGEVDFPAAKRREQPIRRLINKKISENFWTALSFEDKKRLGEAEQAWVSISMIPRDLIPVDKAVYANGFQDRKNKYLLTQRRTIANSLLTVLFILWCYVLCVIVTGQVREWSRGAIVMSEIMKALLPVSLQFFVFCLAARIIKKEKLVMRQDIISRVQPPPFFLGLCFLLAVSPLSYMGYDLHARLAAVFAVKSFLAQPWAALFLLGLFWLMVDAVKLSHYRSFPNALSLSLSWWVAALVVSLAAGSQVRGPGALVALALVHGAVFLFVQCCHYWLHTRTPHGTMHRQAARA